MYPLDFSEPDKLLQVFHRKKTEMSCLENPHTFISQLRDHDLISEHQYQMVNHIEDKEQIKKALYDILDQFEREKSQHIRKFWKCIFQKFIMDQYPTLRHLRKKLTKELCGTVKKGETEKNKGEQRSRLMSSNEGVQPGPSIQLSPRPKMSEIRFSSPLGKEAMTAVRPSTNSQLPVTCGNLEGRLNKDKLVVGRRCILFNGRWFSPPEFEKRAGMRSKNWKSSIRYNGITLKDWMEKWMMKPPMYRAGCKKVTRAKKPRVEPFNGFAPCEKRKIKSLVTWMQGNITSGYTSGSVGGQIVHEPEGESLDSHLARDSETMSYTPTSSVWQQCRSPFPQFKIP